MRVLVACEYSGRVREAFRAGWLSGKKALTHGKLRRNLIA